MNSEKKIVIASDHAGFFLKKQLLTYFSEWEWVDLGPHSSNPVDYTDFAQSLCQYMGSFSISHGVLICGTGMGMCIAANKFPGIRAAYGANSMVARLAKEHNHANVLCFGARVLAVEYVTEILQSWLSATPSQDERHLNRIQHIKVFEQYGKRVEA